MPLTLKSRLGANRSDLIHRIRSNNSPNAIETADVLDAIQGSITSLHAAISEVVAYINSHPTTSGTGISAPSIGLVQYVLSANTNIAAPSVAYQLLVIHILQDAVGEWDVTWDPVYATESLSSYPVNPDANKQSLYLFVRVDNVYELVAASIQV
jgi:hypothetical protein